MKEAKESTAAMGALRESEKESVGRFLGFAAKAMRPSLTAITLGAPRRARTQWALLPGLALALLLPGALSSYWTYIALQCFVYVIAVVGTDIVVGRLGEFSLAQAPLMGLGAYAIAIGQMHGLPTLASSALGLALGAVAGTVVALPALRLSGLRLAVMSFLFTLLFGWAVDVTVNFSGGSEGLIVNPVSILGWSTSSYRVAYYLCFIFAVVASTVGMRLRSGQGGRRLLAIRESELAASSVGIRVARSKISAFALSGVMMAFAGVLYAIASGNVSPSTYGLFPTTYLVVAVILGGRGSVLGSWLGAGYIVLVPQFFVVIGDPNGYALLGGAVLIVVTMAAPDGVAGLLNSFVTFARRRILPRSEESGASEAVVPGNRA